MLMPLISGGFNLSVTFTANISGLAMAWVLHSYGGADAGAVAIILGIAAALATGAAAGWVMGAVIARTGASPILVSLSMMIFLRGLGEFLTRGGDISGFPPFVREMGNGVFLGVPDSVADFSRLRIALACCHDTLAARLRHAHDWLES